MKIEIRIGDYARIKENVIDKRIQQLLIEFKNKQAVRWEGYRNLAFRVAGIDNQNLVILIDNDNNQVHISAKAIEIVN